MNSREKPISSPLLEFVLQITKRLSEAKCRDVRTHGRLALSALPSCGRNAERRIEFAVSEAFVEQAEIGFQQTRSNH